jgi:D-tyrosyl-tRNA(Tyr) deacylase
VTHGDDEAGARRLAERIWHLRVLADDEGRMERSLADVGGGVLVVSQFTLYGDTARGRRPSWVAAAPGAVAEPLVATLSEALRGRGAEVATGRFGADMRVELACDGPVTVLLEVTPAALR